MGVRCSCLNELSIEESSLRFENSKENSKKEFDLDLGEVITLQGVLRGYMDRKKAKVIYSNYRNVKSKIYKKIQNPDLGKVGDLNAQDEVPNYTSPIVQGTVRRLGPYRYHMEGDGIERHSKGPILLSNQAVYVGEWNCLDQRDGYGMQIWPDFTMYEGYWKFDNMLKGRIIYENGDAFDGEFFENKACGKGTYYYNDGTIYTGDWLSDKKHGVGTETTLEGIVYKGEFYQDKKHGKGLMSFNDSSEYHGEFFEDLMQGFGKYSWNDGREYEGEWVNGKMQGKGVFTWNDGRKYIGEYLNDQKHGFGKFVSSNSNVYEGYWVHGKKHGLGVEIFSNGISKKGEWEDGKKLRWVE